MRCWDGADTARGSGSLGTVFCAHRQDSEQHCTPVLPRKSASRCTIGQLLWPWPEPGLIPLRKGREELKQRIQTEWTLCENGGRHIKSFWNREFSMRLCLLVTSESTPLISSTWLSKLEPNQDDKNKHAKQDGDKKSPWGFNTECYSQLDTIYIQFRRWFRIR